MPCTKLTDQLQLQMMRNEINNLKKIIEENGMLSSTKNSNINNGRNNKNSNTVSMPINNVEMTSYNTNMSEDHSDILSMRSVKSFKTTQGANAQQQHYHYNPQQQTSRNKLQDSKTLFSPNRTRQKQLFDQQDKDKYKDTYERSIMSNLNSQLSGYDEYVNTDEDVYEHLSKDKISVPNVFERSRKDGSNSSISNTRSKVSISDWSQVVVPKIENSGGSNISGMGKTILDSNSGSYVLVGEEEVSAYEAPSMTLDANDFSILTQQCLKKYNLLENVGGALKVRSSSSKMTMGRAVGTTSMHETAFTNEIMNENIEEGEDGVSSDDVTDEWDGLILSDVQRLPKFK